MAFASGYMLFHKALESEQTLLEYLRYIIKTNNSLPKILSHLAAFCSSAFPTKHSVKKFHFIYI